MAYTKAEKDFLAGKVVHYLDAKGVPATAQFLRENGVSYLEIKSEQDIPAKRVRGKVWRPIMSASDAVTFFMNLPKPVKNPSSGKKQRAHGVRRFDADVYDTPRGGWHEANLAAAQSVRQYATPSLAQKRAHATYLSRAAKYRPSLPNPGSAAFNTIRVGDRVTITTRFGERTGTAVVKGRGDWALRMGRPHTTSESIATPQNTVRVVKTKKNPSEEGIHRAWKKEWELRRKLRESRAAGKQYTPEHDKLYRKMWAIRETLAPDLDQDGDVTAGLADQRMGRNNPAKPANARIGTVKQVNRAGKVLGRVEREFGGWETFWNKPIGHGHTREVLIGTFRNQSEGVAAVYAKHKLVKNPSSSVVVRGRKTPIRRNPARYSKEFLRLLRTNALIWKSAWPAYASAVTGREIPADVRASLIREIAAGAARNLLSPSYQGDAAAVLAVLEKGAVRKNPSSAAKQKLRGTRYYADLRGKVFDYVDVRDEERGIRGEDLDPSHLDPRLRQEMGSLRIGGRVERGEDSDGWFMYKRVL